MYKTEEREFPNLADIDMTNEEYRDAIKKIFDEIDENYKLRWFYRFIITKLEGSR